MAANVVLFLLKEIQIKANVIVSECTVRYRVVAYYTSLFTITGSK